MAFDVKQAIIDRLRATKRKNIERVIDYMEKYGFFKARCGRHHKYTGGLTSHSWQTYQIALRLNTENCAKNPGMQKLDEDSIAIAALLHDICNCSGLDDVGGHTLRSAVILMEMGLELSRDEYLAVRFHMNLEKKKYHALYSEAKKNPLRQLITEADHTSATLYKGYKDTFAVQQEDLTPYLQNITLLENRNVIYQVEGGWFLGIHSPYDGEIDPDWKDKIIGVKKYDKAKLYPINDSFIGAIYTLKADNKKGLFVIHHCFGMQGGAFFSPDKDPFMYSEIKVYCDWDKWSNFEGNCDNWSSYGYAACKQDNGWKLVKVTQFPMPEYTVIGKGFASAEEAMKSIGIDDCDKYLCKKHVY